MMMTGLVAVLFSIWTFLKNLRLIDAPREYPYEAKLPNLMLGTIIARSVCS